MLPRHVSSNILTAHRIMIFLVFLFFHLLFIFPIKPTFSAPAFFSVLPSSFSLYFPYLQAWPLHWSENACITGLRQLRRLLIVCSDRRLRGEQHEHVLETHTWLLLVPCVARIIVQRRFFANSATVAFTRRQVRPTNVPFSHFRVDQFTCSCFYSPPQ